MNTLSVLIAMMLMGQNAPAKPNQVLTLVDTSHSVLQCAGKNWPDTRVCKRVALRYLRSIKHPSRKHPSSVFRGYADPPQLIREPQNDLGKPSPSDEGLTGPVEFIHSEYSRAEPLTDDEYGKLEKARAALRDAEQEIAKAHGVDFGQDGHPCS